MFANLVDHPADISQSEVAYIGSWLLQVDVVLEGDMSDAHIAFNALKNVADRRCVLKMVV